MNIIEKNQIIKDTVNNVLATLSHFDNTEKRVYISFDDVTKQYSQMEEFELIMAIVWDIYDFINANYDDALTMDSDDIIDNLLTEYRNAE
jgi:transcription elongation factor GreA-like protein